MKWVRCEYFSCVARLWQHPRYLLSSRRNRSLQDRRYSSGGSFNSQERSEDFVWDIGEGSKNTGWKNDTQLAEQASPIPPILPHR